MADTAMWDTHSDGREVQRQAVTGCDECWTLQAAFYTAVCFIDSDGRSVVLARRRVGPAVGVLARRRVGATLQRRVGTVVQRRVGTLQRRVGSVLQRRVGRRCSVALARCM